MQCSDLRDTDDCLLLVNTVFASAPVPDVHIEAAVISSEANVILLLRGTGLILVRLDQVSAAVHVLLSRKAVKTVLGEGEVGGGEEVVSGMGWRLEVNTIK